MACIVHSDFVNGERNCLYLPSAGGNRIGREQLKNSFPKGEAFIDLLFNFSMRFNAFNLQIAEIALFSAVMLIDSGKYAVIILETHQHLMSVLTHVSHVSYR